MAADSSMAPTVLAREYPSVTQPPPKSSWPPRRSARQRRHDEQLGLASRELVAPRHGHEPPPGISRPASLQRRFRVEAEDQLHHRWRQAPTLRLGDRLTFERVRALDVLVEPMFVHCPGIGIADQSDEVSHGLRRV